MFDKVTSAVRIGKELTAYILRSPGAQRIYGCVKDILFEGFDNKGEYPLTLNRLRPYNHWETVSSTFTTNTGKEYTVTKLEDTSTGDLYVLDNTLVKRIKCLLLSIATPIFTALGVLFTVLNRLGKILSGSHFWHKDANGQSLENPWTQLGKDIVHIVLQPFYLLALEFSAIYGLIMPYDGGKLYATFERCAFGRSFLAPCFQPGDTYHLFGGDMSKPNQW